MFGEADFLKRLMPLLVRHGTLSFSSPDVIRYFGRKVNLSGAIPANFNGMLETDLKRRQQGERVKYRMNGNPAKSYDKAYSEIGSVLLGAETTLNTVRDFRAYGSKKAAQNRIFSGGRYGKESPICIAGLKSRKKPTTACGTHWPALTTARAWRS